MPKSPLASEARALSSQDEPAGAQGGAAPSANQLFAKKPLKLLLDEIAGEHRLRRVLGPIQLTSLGVGAIIGAGIFNATCAAAHNVAGPALMFFMRRGRMRLRLCCVVLSGVRFDGAPSIPSSGSG